MFFFDHLDWSPINPSQVSDMEHPFTEEEVFSAICSFGTSKSPGPDGFTTEFFKFFWSTIKSDMILFNDFFNFWGS